MSYKQFLLKPKYLYPLNPGILLSVKSKYHTINRISALHFHNVDIILNWILLQNKQTPIRNTCRSNLWSTLILILWNTEFKILRKKPGDKPFQVLFEFLRCRWDQRLANFNRFSSIETQNCYSCSVLDLHAFTKICYISQYLRFIFIYDEGNSVEMKLLIWRSHKTKMAPLSQINLLCLVPSVKDDN